MPDSAVLGAYLIMTSTVRFLIEFIRINERVALGMTVAQWAALGITAGGAVLLRAGRR